MLSFEQNSTPSNDGSNPRKEDFQEMSFRFYDVTFPSFFVLKNFFVGLQNQRALD